VPRKFSWRRDGELTSLGNPKRTMTLDAPMCADHGSHWSRRVVFNWVVGAIAVILICLTILFSQRGRANESIAGALCFGAFLLAALLLLVNMWFDFTMIKPSEITANAITLTHVSDVFVADLDMLRKAPKTSR
jgi:hypothetical protein